MSDHGLVSRRNLLAGGARLAGAASVLAVAGAWAQESKAVCVDLAADSSNPSLRSALNFTEQSPHSEKACKGCGFFVNDDATGKCGSCKIFSGPTNPNGYCDSWAAPK